MEQTSPSGSGDSSSARSDGLQHQAVRAAKEAFSTLSDGNAIFQQCIASTEPISTIVQSLLAKHGSHSGKRSARLLEKFQKYTLWLQNMSAAIDVAVNASSGIACPIWAPIKYVLKLSRDHYEALEHILRMIETISDCLPRIKIYVKLNAHPMLQTTFLQLFTSIIDFSVVALRYLNRNAFSRAIRHIGRDLESDFGDAMDRLRRHARAVDEMAVATELQQASQYRQSTEKIYQQDLRIRCSEWLRPSNVREVHRRHLGERLIGTCEWIQDQAAYVAWNNPSPKTPEEHQVLLICGQPGCGKSILASAMLERAESQAKNVLYFPFSNGNSARRYVKDLAHSLVWQALDALDDKGCWDTIHGLMSKGPVLTSALWDALASILSHDQRPWTLILDGVDECLELDELLRVRIPGLLRSNGKLQAAILGRPQILQHRRALGITAFIEITPKMVKRDIKFFISERVNDAPLLRDHVSKDLVIRTLQKQAEGMFLWARLVIQDLQKSSSAAEVHQRLGGLPKGLIDTYRQVFNHMHDSLKDDEPSFALVRNTLAFTMICGRPMTFRELRYALALDARTNSGNCMQPLEDFLIHKSAEEFVGICGNLIVISNDQVLLIHTSLREFLFEALDGPASQTDAQIRTFCVPDIEGHRILATSCINYLKLQDYGLPWQDSSSLSDIRVRNPFLKYSAKHVLYHISSSATPCPSLMKEIIEFIRSRFCVSWIEHFFQDMTDDEALARVLEDFDQFMNWTLESSRADELYTEMNNVLHTESRRRHTLLGHDDPSTQRWILFTEFALNFIPQAPSEVAYQAPFVQPSVIYRLPPINTLAPSSAAVNTNNIINQTIRMLNEGHQNNIGLPYSKMDMILRVRNLACRVGELTDPLEMLFKLLLRKADRVPVYTLFMISSFYFRIGKERQGLEVAWSALQKVEGSDTALEFQILKFLADFHTERYEYEKSLPYLSKLADGLLRQRGHVDTDLAVIKLSLGFALHMMDRVWEAEAVFQHLIDLNNSCRGLEQAQLHRAYIYMAYSRMDAKDPEGGITWFQKAMDIPDALNKYVAYRDLTNIGAAVLKHTHDYERALHWLGNSSAGCPTGVTISQNLICEREYWLGRCLNKLQRYDEAFSILQQALLNRDKVIEEANLPWRKQMPTKNDILQAIHDLGHAYFATENYARSLECYRTVNQAWTASPGTHGTETCWSQVYEAVSLYGVGEVEQGIQLLRGLEEGLSTYSDATGGDLRRMLYVKYLIGFGSAQLSTCSIIEAKEDFSLHKLPPFGLKKQRSLDILEGSKTLRGSNDEWKYFFGVKCSPVDRSDELFRP